MAHNMDLNALQLTITEMIQELTSENQAVENRCRLLESQTEELRRENLDFKTSCQQQMLCIDKLSNQIAMANSNIESILDRVILFCTDDSDDKFEEFFANLEQADPVLIEADEAYVGGQEMNDEEIQKVEHIAEEHHEKEQMEFTSLKKEDDEANGSKLIEYLDTVGDLNSPLESSKEAFVANLLIQNEENASSDIFQQTQTKQVEVESNSESSEQKEESESNQEADIDASEQDAFAELSNEEKPTNDELNVKESDKHALSLEYSDDLNPTEIEESPIQQESFENSSKQFPVNQNATQIDENETSPREFPSDQKLDNANFLIRKNDETCSSDESLSQEILNGQTPAEIGKVQIQKSSKEVSSLESSVDHNYLTTIDEFPLKKSDDEFLPIDELHTKSLNTEASSPENSTKVDEAPIKKSSSEAHPEECADAQNPANIDEIKNIQDPNPHQDFPPLKQSSICGDMKAPSEFPQIDDKSCKAEQQVLVEAKEKPHYPVLLKSEDHMSYEDSLKILPESMTLKLISKNFRDRMDGFSILKESIQNEEISASVLFGFLSKSGFKDANVQVISKMYETLSSACAWSKTFSLSFAELAFPQCLVSLAESKATASINDFLFELAECIGADHLQGVILKHLEGIKSTKSIQLSLSFLAELLKQFGANAFAGLVSMIDSIKISLTASQLPVRQAAMDFFAELSLQTGNKFEARIIDGLNPSLAKSLKEKLKESPDSEYEPSRKHRIVSDDSKAASSAKTNKKKTALAISKELSAWLLKMNDGDWKVRQECLKQVEKIFSMSGGDCDELNSALQANVFQSIALRLKDSNKNIVGIALKLALKVAQSIGKSPDRTIRVLIDGLCQTVGDSKKSISQGAEDALLEWVKHESCFALFAQKFEKAAQTAGAKASLLSILKTGFSVHRDFQFQHLLPRLLLLLNDKNKEARDKAELVIDLLLPNINFDQILSAIRKFSSQEQKVICSIMERKGVKIKK